MYQNTKTPKHSLNPQLHPQSSAMTFDVDSYSFILLHGFALVPAAYPVL